MPYSENIHKVLKIYIRLHALRDLRDFSVCVYEIVSLHLTANISCTHVHFP
jgi:hypothetical protein